MKRLLFTLLFLVSLSPSFAQGKLEISEIMYHSQVTDTTILIDAYEFIEITNTGNTALDISGYSIDKGVFYVFPANTLIQPNEFIVLVKDSTFFGNKYPGVTIGGQYAGGLKNGGETIRIIDPLFATVFSVTYNDVAPWPTLADGFGFSLVSTFSTTTSPDLAAYWQIGQLDGTPGQSEPQSNNNYPIVINEILSSPVLGELDAIELYNDSDSIIDIGGWYLSDEKANPFKYSFFPGTTVPAKGYFVVKENLFNPFNLGFSFSRKGDKVFLFSSDSANTLSGYEDSWSFDAQLSGVSFGRVTTSINETYMIKQDTSLGRANSPEVGPVVISALSYAPNIALDEFIILKNISDTTVTFLSPHLPDSNAYRMDGVTFKFPFAPNEVSLENGKSIILSSLTPADFRTKYLIDQQTQVFQYTTGGISSSGEAIRLQFPAYRDTLADNSYDNHYVTMDEVIYNNVNWPDANKNGFYLQKINLSGISSDPINWIASQNPISDILGIENNETDKKILLYPTISNGNIHLQSNEIITLVQVLNTSGVSILNKLVEQKETTLNDLPEGYYIVRISTNSGTITRKVIITK